MLFYTTIVLDKEVVKRKFDRPLNLLLLSGKFLKPPSLMLLRVRRLLLGSESPNYCRVLEYGGFSRSEPSTFLKSSGS